MMADNKIPKQQTLNEFNLNNSSELESINNKNPCIIIIKSI